jgi:prophage regulatory protein
METASRKPTRLIRIDEVCSRLGYSRATVWRMVKTGQFPRPLKPYPDARASAWIETEIDDYIAAAIARRDAEHGEVA